ncbi:heme-binding protein [Puia sp.]|jgi:uncharacterized protein GlcG (DUF336 family)|uniref:GlcG/HbpS family heme-binding protein n=1 Tax=Puia sp. TaxID=2045100 RepID=UPI002F3FEAA4
MEITLEQANELQKKARARAMEIGIPVNIAIMDTGGHLKSLQRMDDALIGSLDIAIQKAKTAMLFRMPSEQVGQFLKPEAAAYGLEHTNGGLVGFAGGLPIRRDGEIIGYIGVSGGAIAQDAMIAAEGSII